MSITITGPWPYRFKIDSNSDDSPFTATNGFIIPCNTKAQQPTTINGNLKPEM